MFRYLNKAEVITFAVFFCIVLFWVVFGFLLIPTYFSLMFLSIAALFAILPAYILRVGYRRYKYPEEYPMPVADNTKVKSTPASETASQPEMLKPEMKKETEPITETRLQSEEKPAVELKPEEEYPMPVADNTKVKSTPASETASQPEMLKAEMKKETAPITETRLQSEREPVLKPKIEAKSKKPNLQKETQTVEEKEKEEKPVVESKPEVESEKPDLQKETQTVEEEENAKRKEQEIEWLYGGARKELGFYYGGGSTDSIRVHSYLPPKLQKRVDDPDKEIRKVEITKLAYAVGDSFITFLSLTQLANSTFAETLLVQWEKNFINCIALRIQQHLEHLHLKNQTGSVQFLIGCEGDADSEKMREFKKRLYDLQSIYQNIELEVCLTYEDWKEKMRHNKKRKIEEGEENIYTAYKAELMTRRISYKDTVTPEEKELGEFSWALPCLGTAAKLGKKLGFKEARVYTEYDASFYDYEDRATGFSGHYDSVDEAKKRICGDYVSESCDYYHSSGYGDVVWDNLVLQMERGTQHLVIKCWGHTVRFYTSAQVMEELIPILPKEIEAYN